MKITKQIRLHAFRQVLYALQVHIGGRIFMRDLRESWGRDTGLRDRDLETTLDELTLDGAIVLRDHSDGVLVELTSSGAAMLEAPLITVGDLIDHCQAWWVLSKTQRRARRQLAAAYDRWSQASSPVVLYRRAEDTPFR
ncbi:hypothetical protein [Algiphilus sp.]|uniref:hypothetical protein n=1 Tax=Algiphilus sp. TaxID=1872431 RepID=UPI0032EE156D